MKFSLSSEEAAQVAFVPVGDLVDLAVELDHIPAAEIERSELLPELIPRLYELAQREGLPFSKYDAEDLDELPSDHRAALASAMGWGSGVSAILKQGAKVYKTYRDRKNSQVALLLPCLLKPLARYAAERQG
ncbi:MAG: hypothetical protein GY913_02630 [Proteobacteria bacterium]|nr:hypothetical protein [Pseudomonadota bacterium]MCP4915794.1 hypothetical protein [Pseudomonadota bacterium]